jgi:hypothetical protein
MGARRLGHALQNMGQDRRRAADHWLLPQFTLHGVTPILRGEPDFGTAIGNPGLLAIAAALRSPHGNGSARLPGIVLTTAGLVP